MSAPLFHQKGLIGMKAESTNGTVNAPGNSEVIIVYDLEFDSLSEAEVLERFPIWASQSVQTPIAGTLAGTCSFTQHVGGSGTAATLPPFDEPLRACGWNLGVDSPVTTHTYTPSSLGAGGMDSSSASEGATWTIYFWDDGILRKLAGATGNCKIIMEPGAPIRHEYEFTGVYVASTETVVVASPSLPAAAEPPRAVGSSITWTPDSGSAWTGCLRSLEIDLQRDIVPRPDLNAGTTGIKAFTSPKRDPIMTVVIEQPTSLTASTSGQNWETVFTTPTRGAWSIGSIGSASGNTGDIDCPEFGVKSVARSEEDGIVALTLEGTLAADSTAEAAGNNEVSYVWT